MRSTQVPRAQRRDRRADFAAAAITLLAFGLYVWGADAKGIWWDEGLSLTRALGTPAAILSNRLDFPGAPTVDQHPPLYFLVLHAFLRGAGESDLALRFPSVLCATLVVPLVYALGRRLRSRTTGRLAALLAALAPFHLWYAQEARPYTMVTALGAASALALWRAAIRRSRTGVVAAGGLAALAVLTQYFAATLLVFAALFGLVLWLGVRRASRAHGTVSWRGWWAAACAIPVVALGLVVWTVWPLIPMLAIHRSYVPLHIILLDSLNSFALGLSVNLRNVWPYDVAFAVLLVLGALSLVRRPPSLGRWSATPAARRAAGLVFLLGYLLIPAFGIWATSLRVPVYMNSRYVIISSPAFCLGVALGLEALWRRRRAAGALALAVLLVGIGGSLERYHRHERYAALQDYRGAAAFVAANERVGDAVIVTGHENVAPFLHYYHGVNHGHLPVAAAPARAFEVERIGADLVSLAQGHGRLWLIDCPAYVSDPKGLVVQWLEEHMRPGDRRAFPGYYGAAVTVRTYTPHDPVNPAPAAAGPAIGEFGDLLALRGYALRFFDRYGQPQEAEAGEEPLHIGEVPVGNVVSGDLRVRVLGPLPELKTSLRLVNAEGTSWAQHDREPLRILSTRAWPAGGEVTFDVDLPVPPGTPPGIYELQLLMYDVETLAPVPFRAAGAASTDGAPALLLGHVIVDRAERAFTRAELLGKVAPLRLPASYGRALALEGYDLAPTSLGSDDLVTLHLFWRVRDPEPWRYEIVLNWTDAAGRVVHTAARPVALALSMTGGWRRGDGLHDIMRFAPPEGVPAGDYTVHLLVRDKDEGRHLRLTRGIVPWPRRNLELGTITIRGGGE